MIPTYIISLAYNQVGSPIGRENRTHALDRISTVENTARKMGWHTHRYPAIDGHAVDITELVLSTPLTPGEIGCALSHLALWRLCQSQRSPIIVLEDDVLCVANYTTLDTEYDLLKLHTAINIHGKGTRRKSKTYGTWTPGAYAYYLTPRAADKLVSRVNTHGLGPVDKVMGSNIVDFAHIEDPLFQLIPHGHSSTRPSNR
jgi:GR25 family glycosyltransferase involved in LPS biosynthesis